MIGRTDKSVGALRTLIKRLPADPPKSRPGKTWTTQKAHWLGWLSEYHTPGYYGRKGGKGRDARFAFNHVLDYEMVTWLAQAGGVKPGLVKKAKTAALKQMMMQRQAAAARRVIPWEVVASALWD